MDSALHSANAVVEAARTTKFKRLLGPQSVFDVAIHYKFSVSSSLLLVPVHAHSFLFLSVLCSVSALHVERSKAAAFGSTSLEMFLLVRI